MRQTSIMTKKKLFSIKVFFFFLQNKTKFQFIVILVLNIYFFLLCRFVFVNSSQQSLTKQLKLTTVFHSYYYYYYECFTSTYT